MIPWYLWICQKLLSFLQRILVSNCLLFNGMDFLHAESTESFKEPWLFDYLIVDFPRNFLFDFRLSNHNFFFRVLTVSLKAISKFLAFSFEILFMIFSITLSTTHLVNFQSHSNQRKWSFFLVKLAFSPLCPSCSFTVADKTEWRSSNIFYLFKKFYLLFWS